MARRVQGGGLKKGAKYLLLLFLFFLCVLGIQRPVQAKNKWVKKSAGYEYVKNGKVQTGLVKIGKKTYYFDPEGIQRTGWRKIHNKYYFFKQGTKKQGYMVSDRYVDGISIPSSGIAKVSSDGARRKLELMVRCQRLVEGVTRFSDSRETKKRKLFTHMMNNYVGEAIPSLESRRDLDVAYAEWMISYGAGDCYAFAALYTYLLNAAGFDDALFVASGGHAWSELDGLVYDTHWARVIGFGKCYAVPEHLSGVDGRPKWFQNRLYIYSVNDRPRG